MPRIQSIYRLKSNYNNSISQPILAKCSSLYERNFFLKAIAIHRRENKNCLRLNMLGFNSYEPFYISCFTRENQLF